MLNHDLTILGSFYVSSYMAEGIGTLWANLFNWENRKPGERFCHTKCTGCLEVEI